MEISVSGKDYIECEEASHNLWCNSKTGHYGSGILNNQSDPRKTERIGLLGEKSFSLATGLSCDFSYKRNGDSGDFLIQNIRIDVKTSAKYPTYKAGLIYAEHENGVAIELKSNIYVFAYLKSEDTIKKLATISFLGYTYRETILQLQKVPAIKGKHKNYQVSFDSLKPIDRLITNIRGSI